MLCYRPTLNHCRPCWASRWRGQGSGHGSPSVGDIRDIRFTPALLLQVRANGDDILIPTPVNAAALPLSLTPHSHWTIPAPSAMQMAFPSHSKKVRKGIPGPVISEPPHSLQALWPELVDIDYPPLPPPNRTQEPFQNCSGGGTPSSGPKWAFHLSPTGPCPSKYEIMWVGGLEAGAGVGAYPAIGMGGTEAYYVGREGAPPAKLLSAVSVSAPRIPSPAYSLPAQWGHHLVWSLCLMRGEGRGADCRHGPLGRSWAGATGGV